MKEQKVLLIIAGLVCLFFTAFHLAFYRIFNWSVDLNNISAINRAIFLTYHCIVILILLFMAAVSLFQSNVLLESRLKYSVLGMFILFFLLRIVCEFVFFGYTSSSPVIILLCLVPAALYAIPLLFQKKNNRL